MKPIRTIVLSTLLASLLLTAAACNKGQSVGEDQIQSAIHESTLSASAETVTVESETTLLRSSCHTPIDEKEMEAARLAAEEASRLASEAESIRVEAERAASAALAAAKATADVATKIAKEQTSPVTRLQKPPTVLLQYQFVLRETTIPQEDELRLVHASYLQPCTYSWTLEDANGTP
ncbi:MAG: hypothetical protein J6S59_03325, partial [Clostridia bacterium]|nr:hypothetical protein [Clostridia bacterium]